MDLLEKYELLEDLESGHTGTVRARERASGSEVQIHFLAMSKEAEHLMDQVKALPLAESGHVFHTGDHEGAFFVVTAPGMQPLKDWPKTDSTKSPRDPNRLMRAGSWRVPAAPATAAPGDFTQMFQAPLPSVTQAMPAPRPSAPVEDGEFTRLFGASAPPAAPAQPPPPAGPGEFTRMFRAETTTPSASPEPARPASPQKPAEAGDFTRMFQAPAVAKTPVAPPPASQPAKPVDPGEFTRMFRAPAAPPPPAAADSNALPLAQPSVPSGATGAFAAPQAQQRPIPQTGPSEFTRMIAVQPVQASAAAVPSSAPVAPPPEKTPLKQGLNIAVLVAIIEGVVILALALALFFVLKK